MINSDNPFELKCPTCNRAKNDTVNSTCSNSFHLPLSGAGVQCTCYYINGQYVYNTECKSHPDESKLGQLERDNANLRSVMIAAAEEIKRCWDGHCDEDGYGPANLLHRLEKGIPAQYGYTAGAFESLQKENEKLTEITTCDQHTKLNIKGKVSDLEAQLEKAKELLQLIHADLTEQGMISWVSKLYKEIESFLSTNEVKE